MTIEVNEQLFWIVPIILTYILGFIVIRYETRRCSRYSTPPDAFEIWIRGLIWVLSPLWITIYSIGQLVSWNNTYDN